MDSEQEPEQEGPKAKKPGRGWTERFTGPIRYRRFTDYDHSGRRAIFFKFEPAPGQGDQPQAVYDILQEMKHMQRGPGHGRGQQPTNLTFVRSKKHGRVWRLPDDPVGRTAADIIDAKLQDLATQMEAGEGRGL
jgi:hypothetical protein